LEYLECHGESDHKEISKKCFCSEKYARHLLYAMKSENIIRVVAWRHNANGGPTPIYQLGPGKNKPAPTAETIAARMRKRRSSLIFLYGIELANKILKNTRNRQTTVVREGRKLTPKDHDAHIAGRIYR
jgi:hypothetical protein